MAAASPIPPTVEIAPGVEMFRVSLGTCCGSQPKTGLAPWLAAGGRGIDTAYDYGKNVPGGPQQDVAAVLAETGTARADVFITSKIPAGLDPTGKQCKAGSPEAALSVVKENLRELNTTYLDLVLLHAPCHSLFGGAPSRTITASTSSNPPPKLHGPWFPFCK
eukprot:SAG22_NODE_6232_length_882_cov_1.731801_1_plen_163_part_00